MISDSVLGIFLYVGVKSVYCIDAAEVHFHGYAPTERETAGAPWQRPTPSHTTSHQ